MPDTAVSADTKVYFDVDHAFIDHLNGDCLDWAAMDIDALQQSLRAGTLTNVAQVVILLGCAFAIDRTGRRDRKSTRLNSSHVRLSRMPSSA